jgi:hypothetical protein
MLASLTGTPPAAALLMRLQPVAFAPGEYLFHAGDAGDGCYLIDSGTVALHVSRLGGNQLLGPGEVVDVAGLLRGRERAADAYAQTAVRARWLPADALTTHCLHRPDSLPLVGARLDGEVKNVPWLQASAADVQSAAELASCGASASAAIARWSDVRVANLVRDLATQVAERAEHLAASAVAEAGEGNLVAETRANQQASLAMSEALAYRQMTKSSDGAYTASAHPTVELCFVPQRYPVATAVAAALLALDAGRALMLSCEQAAHQRCRHVGRLIAEVLTGHGASHNLVQWVQWGTDRETALGLMASRGNVVLFGDDVNREQEQGDKR